MAVHPDPAMSVVKFALGFSARFGVFFLFFEASSLFSSSRSHRCDRAQPGLFGSASSRLSSIFGPVFPARASQLSTSRTTCYPDRSGHNAHSAHDDFSVPSSRETSAPNLSHGQQGSASQGRCEQRSVSEIHASRGPPRGRCAPGSGLPCGGGSLYWLGAVVVMIQPSFSGVARPV